MTINILLCRKFLTYFHAMLSYKQSICRLLNIKLAVVNTLYKEINTSRYMEEISRKSGIRRGFFDFSMLSVLRAPTLYVLCRILKPEIVVETGVAEGFSSSLILYALKKNNKGNLYSIDLPNQPGQNLEEDKTTGWLVPEYLRKRWALILGSSREKLPGLLNNLKKLDIFYHDSDHSYDNMMFEFEEAKKILKPEGILISDDITENDAFFDFCREYNLKTEKLFKIGIAKK